MFLKKFLPSSDRIVDRLLYNKTGQICVSVLLGLGLASIFRKVCDDNQCRVLRAAPLANIKNKVFKVDDKCVKYIPYSVACKTKEKLVVSS